MFPKELSRNLFSHFYFIHYNIYMQDQIDQTFHIDLINVKIAEMITTDRPVILKTTLGSCVGIVLHDCTKHISGIVHIMLPKMPEKDPVISKYADTAIPALLEKLISRFGTERKNLKAWMVGGANMFNFCSESVLLVGDRNVEESRKILEGLGVPIVFEDIGGVRGKTVMFNNATGEIQVKKLKKVELIKQKI